MADLRQILPVTPLNYGIASGFGDYLYNILSINNNDRKKCDPLLLYSEGKEKPSIESLKKTVLYSEGEMLIIFHRPNIASDHQWFIVKLDLERFPSNKCK